jgi:GxxExxY protein
LDERGLAVETEVVLPLTFKGVKLDAGYRIDLWIERKVILEVKSVEALHPIHTAQLLTYLKLADNRLGLLVNFNEKLVRDGIRRVVNGLSDKH